MYPEYCKLSLVRYKPWVGDYPYQETDDDIVVQEWKTFISEMQHPPDHLIQEYKAAAHDSDEWSDSSDSD